MFNMCGERVPKGWSGICKAVSAKPFLVSDRRGLFGVYRDNNWERYGLFVSVRYN